MKQTCGMSLPYILEPGMCLSVLPASSYHRCCFSSVRLYQPFLPISSTLVNYASCLAWETWGWAASSQTAVLLLIYPVFLLFILFKRYPQMKLELIVIKLNFPELLNEVHLCSRVSKWGGRWSSRGLWALKTRASLVRDTLAWKESLLKALPLRRYALCRSTESPFQSNSCYTYITDTQKCNHKQSLAF